MRLEYFLTKIPWINHLQRILGIILGAIMTAVSINSLIIPNKIADGGITGIAILLHYLLDWPISWMVFLLNLPLFLMGWKMVGRVFLSYSIIGVITLSISLNMSSVIPTVTSDTLLAAIYGGVLSGIGMGIIFRCRGSLGGTDILAVFFSRTTSFSVGQILMGIDAIIFIVTAILLSPEMAMYAMIYMFIATKVIDLVQEGMNHSKSVLVVTSEPSSIAKDIMEKLGRGVTLFSAMGAYSGEMKQVVYCIINRTEISQMKEIIHAHDTRAFLAISDVPEVVGEGFKAWKGH
jgi:uncharacterized membrane-anchored protein YitT (DUF2179 family)